MPSDPAQLLARHDPAKHTRPIARRKREALPFDLAVVGATDQVMPDTNLYIDALKGHLPKPVGELIANTPVLHSSVAACELAIATGLLDPAHPGTAANRTALLDVVERMKPPRLVSPSPDAWIEAAVIAGICARTQNYPGPERRRLLNDALIFLSAIEEGAVLVTRNIRDADLLLNFRPDARVVLYDRVATATAAAAPSA